MRGLAKLVEEVTTEMDLKSRLTESIFRLAVLHTEDETERVYMYIHIYGYGTHSVDECVY